MNKIYNFNLTTIPLNVKIFTLKLRFLDYRKSLIRQTSSNLEQKVQI